MKTIYVQQFIQYISRYPSGDNCQPFLFQYKNDHNLIEVYHDSNIAQHALNPLNVCSLMSLGALLELASICSLENHFKITKEVVVHFEKGQNLSSGLWAKIHILTFPDKDLSFATLMKIKTNRGPYLTSDVILNDQFLNDRVFFTKEISKDSKSLILKMENKVLWKNNQVLKDLFSWVRLTSKKYRLVKDGFHYSELDMNFFEAAFFVLMRMFCGGKYLHSIPFLSFMANVKSKINLNRTDSFAVILSKFETLEDFLVLGADFMKLRYFILKYDFESQPLSVSTFPFIFALNEIQPQTQEVVEIGLSLQKSLKIDFKADFKGLNTAWLIRLGKPVRPRETSLRKN